MGCEEASKEVEIIDLVCLSGRSDAIVSRRFRYVKRLTSPTRPASIAQFSHVNNSRNKLAVSFFVVAQPMGTNKAGSLLLPCQQGIISGYASLEMMIRMGRRIRSKP
jgi:hypothetical protein